jgi:glutamate N-acetyltransferase/amino-acid N-acetyltransferase
MLETSRFAPPSFPHVEPVPGVRGATTSCSLKSDGGLDLLVVEVAPGTTVAGVFTQSSVTSYAVQRSRASARGGQARALVVHSGNANALTGEQGRALVERICDEVAEQLRCPSEQVLMAGTGIIGERVTDEQIVGVLPAAIAALGEVRWEDCAEAISTTDTFPKGATRTLEIGGEPIVVSGIAKGSGMIAPDMATMLCFIYTNAAVDADELRAILGHANMRSFRRISVDGDESTSDTMLAFATQAAGLGDGDDRPAALEALRDAVAEVAFDLAMQVVSDGEGISKLIEVTVTGARTPGDAHAMAKAIAESPLVKTAIAGGHANWGRIAMAVGKAHRPVLQERLAIWLGEHRVAVDGDRDDDVDQAALDAYMEQDRIEVRADVAMGHEAATVWTCDLTERYIDINAHYAT